MLASLPPDTNAARRGGSQVPGRFRQRVVVLLVEDNPDDVVMIRKAFEQPQIPIQLMWSAMVSKR
jgi:hypothetical protein